MLLHAGAGLHGHEYSSTQTSKHSHQVQINPHSTSKDTKLDVAAHSAPRPLSQLLPGMEFVTSFLPSAKSLWDRPSSDYFLKNYLPARFRDDRGEDRESSDYPSQRTSVDGNSFPQYIQLDDETQRSCDTTCASSQCSKTKRSKTRFHFARPVPGSQSRHKRTQPRILLQLRREHHGRPLPSIEVVPATHVSGTKLNSDDLLVMRSDYDRIASWYGQEKSADDFNKEPDVLAVMTPCGTAGDGSAEIVMEDGSVWYASRKPNGGYEFCHITDQGSPLTVRWVRRQPASPRSTQQFSFCIMDPLVRKHPFLGSLKPFELDVFETYTPAYSRLQGPRPASYAGDGYLPTVTSKRTADVPNDQKRLMTVTAIWVSFCEDNWPGILPSTSRSCKSKAATFSRRVSGDDSGTPSLPTSPVRKSFAQMSDTRPVCAFQGQRSASTGAAFMERRRAAARTASPSTGSEEGRAEQLEKHPRRSKMRAWAHRLMHPRSTGHRTDSDRGSKDA